MYANRSGHISIKCLRFALTLISKMCVYVIKRLGELTLRKTFWALMLLCICFIIWTNENNLYQVKKTDNPVIVWWTDGFPGTLNNKNCPGNIKCDVYTQGERMKKNLSEIDHVDAFMFYGSLIKFDNMPLPRKPKEIIWGLFHEESPINVNLLMYEKILKLFNYSSTYSRYSDIPFPLQSLQSFDDIISKTYFVTTSVKNNYLTDIAPVLYLQSNCGSSTERDDYVKELMKFINIDSYGDCLNNKKLDPKFKENHLNHLEDNEFYHFVARYKFVIAMENAVCEDYITEKLWRAIIVGSVPIYFGSPSIRDWLPNNKSAILLEDFPTPKILSTHLFKLLGDDKLYEEYLEHKLNGIVSNARVIDELRLRPNRFNLLDPANEFECLICKKLHEKRKGFIEWRNIDKSHYNCPVPVSALTFTVNPENMWVSSLILAEKRADEFYDKL